MPSGRTPGSKNRVVKSWRDKFPNQVTTDLYINRAKFDARIYESEKNDCWHMSGGQHPQGYPMIPGYKISTGRAGMHTGHRVMYQLHHGAIPQGQNVIHQCLDMTCVNPAHLFLGTAEDRGAHMREMGHTTLGISQRRECRKQANRTYKYTEEEIRFVRTASLEDIMKRFGWSRTKARGKKYTWTHECYLWLE